MVSAPGQAASTLSSCCISVRALQAGCCNVLGTLPIGSQEYLLQGPLRVTAPGDLYITQHVSVHDIHEKRSLYLSICCTRLDFDLGLDQYLIYLYFHSTSIVLSPYMIRGLSTFSSPFVLLYSSER